MIVKKLQLAPRILGGALAFLVLLAQTTASAEVLGEQHLHAEAHHKPCIALVLGGGGLRGVSEIPIIEALQKEHIPIDLVVGTSIGSIIGGLYCAGVPIEEIKRRSVTGFISNYFSAPIAIQLLKVPFDFLTRKNPEGLYKGTKLSKALDKRVSHKDISQLKPKFAAVATDLVLGQPNIITSGDLGVALQASSAVPIFRAPVANGDKLLVDGGVMSNLPVREAKQLGADFVIAVDIDEDLLRIDPKVFRKKIGSISSRIIGLILNRSDEIQMQQADFCIHPDVTGIALLSSSKADGKLALDAGQTAIDKAMPDLKAKLREIGAIE